MYENPRLQVDNQLELLSAALAERYRLDRELGRGGMATVYLAHDLKHHRAVALKVLKPELATALGPERFLREITFTARLDHPHILPLLDSGEAGGFLYYVMPYVEGESLRDRLSREKQLSLNDALEIAREVADALSYAHSQGVVHRDVKPENILLAAGHARLGDFGIARAIAAASAGQLTETGLAIGTPVYMSPEQTTGDRALDGRTDEYSLGCVIYEMLAGEPPFTGATAEAILARKSLEAPPSLRVVRETVSEALECAIAKSIARVPADRFATVQHFAQELASASITPSRATHEQRRGETWKPLAIVASMVTLAVIAVAGRWLSTRHPGPSIGGIQRLAVLPFGNLMNDSAQEYFVQGMHEALISELTRAGIPVIARTSVMHYLNVNKAARDIARELHVDALIEGSVFRAADSVEIQVRLVDGRTEEGLWAESYVGDMRNVLVLQRRITRAVASRIRVALGPGVQARLASTATVNPEALDAYLRGRFHAYRLTLSDFETSLEYFQRALDRQPRYAIAHTGIAFAWGAAGYLGYVPHRTAFLKANEAIQRAIDLDDSLAETHDVLARLLFYYRWDWSAAEREYQRAIELNPNYADAHSYFGLFLTWMGRTEEAREQLDRALELDPLNPLFHFHLALHSLLNTRRDDDAVAAFRDALQALPDFPWSHHYLWLALHQQKRYQNAAAEARIFFGGIATSGESDALARVHSDLDYRAAMGLMAARLASDSNQAADRAGWIAQLYAQAGEKERALAWLENASRNHDPYLINLGIGLGWDLLRNDSRFYDLARRMGFPMIRTVP